MQTSASKFTFQSKNKLGSKSYLSDEIRPNWGSGKHVLFQHDNYETTTSNLAVETFQTAELSLKWRAVLFTAARGLPELATTLEKLNCFYSEHRRGYQTKLLTDHSKGGCLTVEVRFTEMTGDCHYSERTHSPCKFSMLFLDSFAKLSSSSKTQTAYLVFSFVVSHVSVISASVMNIAVYWSVRQVEKSLFNLLLDCCIFVVQN